MSRSLIASASPSIGLAFTEKKPWFINRSGGSVAVGEIYVLDLLLTSPQTTNRRFGDPNSCWTNIVRATNYDDADCGIFVLIAEPERPTGRVKAYVWGMNVPGYVRNYAQDALDPTPTGRPLAAPFSDETTPPNDYNHNMRHMYCATFANDLTVTTTPGVPNTQGGKYCNLTRYIGLLGEPLLQGTTGLVKTAFDGWKGFSQAGNND